MNKILGIITAAVCFYGISHNIYGDEAVTDISQNIKTEESIQSTLSEATDYTQTDVYESPYQNTNPYPYGNIGMGDYSQPADVTIQEIRVENVVISEFKNEMNIKETQNISATVLPVNATNTTISYVSSNNSVATVDPVGKITAVGKGTCTITAEADGFATNLDLKVKVKTSKISVEKIFVTLKPDQTYQLNAKAVPDDASQFLKYKSNDENIVNVDNNGLVTAKNTGEAMIMISNDDAVISVNIIVNSSDVNKSENVAGIINNNNISANNRIAEKIKNSSENMIVVNNLKNVSSDILKQLYGTDKSLMVECNGYDIIINGRDLKNIENELSTDIEIKEENSGIELLVNGNKGLPGKIKIEFNDKSSNYKYMYIYNNAEGKYEPLNSLISTNSLEIDYSGKYLITNNKLKEFKINILVISVAGSLILVLTGIYIFIKKKYWFW